MKPYQSNTQMILANDNSMTEFLTHNHSSHWSQLSSSEYNDHHQPPVKTLRQLLHRQFSRNNKL